MLNHLYAKIRDLPLSDKDVVAQTASQCFDISVWQFLAALLVGGQVQIFDDEITHDPALMLDQIEQRKLTILEIVPSMMRMMVTEVGHRGDKPDLSTLRWLIPTGEALPPELCREWFRHNPEIPLLNAYGPTECSDDVTHCRIEEALSESAIRSPIGRPIANTQIYVLNEGLEPQPIGVVGELYVGGVGVGRGYLNETVKTAEYFLPCGYGKEAGGRLYRSGDIARYLADGNLEYLGRIDHQVKIRGFRIELGEIEAALGRHPSIEEAVVVAREGVEGERRLAAYVVAKPEREVAVSDLREYLKRELPEYMWPGAYVMLEALPLTENGKLDRRALPAPEGGAYLKRDYEAPKGETETKLAKIWAETLKLERVGRHDNFFELGGHSLLAVTMIERMRGEGMRSDVRTLFTAPTLRALAEAVKGRRVSEVETPPSLIPAGCRSITPEMLPLIALTQPEIDAVAAMTPGGAANIQDIYPLAPLQEGILFHHLMSAEGDAYLLSCLLAFDTRERLEVFINALQAVIARHDILRTAVVWEGLPDPAQVVWREAPLIVEEVCLNPENGEIARQLQSRFDPRLHQLDVRKAPLIRGFAAYDGAGERWLLLCLSHHLTIDHATLEIMTGEARAYMSGEADRLPEPLPFRNFVAQARLRNGREEHEAFFREMLGDVDEPAAPFGLTGAHGNGSEIEEAQFELEIGLSRRLRGRARILGVSAASLFHLAWALMLARVSGRDDVVFGTVLLGRMQGDEGAMRTLGLFINTLPVRIRVDEEGVESSARRVHRLLAELIGHEHASLALAQRCSGVEAPAPLFSALLNYRHSPREMEADAETVRAWTGVEILASEERTNYPLTLSIDDLGDGFRLTAQTTALVEPLRIYELLRTALERLVEALEKAPETPVRAIDALPEAERRQIVEDWNATEADYPKERMIHELFEEQAEKSPHAIALVYQEQSLTYGALNARANRLAHHLRKLGVGPEARVAICLERSLEMVVAMLATLKAGGAYVPLDPAYPSERLAYMLVDSAPLVLLTHGATSAALSAHAPGVCVVDLDTYAKQWDGNSEANPDRAGARLNAQCLAYILYTSGSTGLPKGVTIEHRSVVNFICWAKSAFEADELERTLFSTSINFDLAVYECFVPLTVGATITIVGNALDLTQSPVEVTLINTVPSAMKSLVDIRVVPKSIRTVNLAGEALKQELVESIFAETPAETVCNLYGPSETTTYSTWVAMKRGKGFEPHIGAPIANTQIYILDEWLKPSPVGVTGEIHIGGEGEARGYLNHPEMTAGRFLPDPFSKGPGGRVYKTGDLGRWAPAGKIEFLGRNDFQVKIRGYRIELGEIESRLMGHPEVREAVVAPREDEEGGKSLVAYYTGGNVGAETLRGRILSELPEYMAPSAYVHLERLPLTPNGKLDRRKLPAPESGDYLTRGYEAPRGETEIRIARIWVETLKVERVGRHDNFFELGGHSLLAITIVERMRREGLHADVRALFATSTLAAFAAAVGGDGDMIAVPPNRIPPASSAITSEMLPLVELSAAEIELIVSAVPGGTANVQDIYPLAPLQEGILFHHLMAPEGDVYLAPALLSFDTRDRLDAFLQAMQAVIERHDILRTAVLWEGLPEPVQVVYRQAPLAVKEVNLDSTAIDVAEELRARFDPRHYRLDIRRAPLMHVCIAHDARAGRWVMLHLFHHLLGDHTALEVLLQEIHANLLGREGRLPAPPPFRNFVAQARLGMSRQEHEAFFQEMLGDVDEPTTPFGLINVQGDGSGIREARREVDGSLASRLRKIARALGVGAASLFHLAWAQVLARVSGRDDVVFGTVLFGRMQGGEGAARAPGLFINTLPIRIRIGGDSVRDSVRQTHILLAQLLRHEHAPLALAQRCSAVAAPAPLFSALFNYRHRAGAEAMADAYGETPPSWEGIELLGGEDRTNYPFNLIADDLGEGFALRAQVQSPIDPIRVCAYMHMALEQLVGALEHAPATPVCSLDALPVSERNQLLVEWNATEAEYPHEQPIHTLFEAQAARTPDAVAVVDEGCQLSYGELNAQANRLALYLGSLGVQSDARVAILLDRSLELVLAELAILKCGAAYVPLDQNAPVERLAFMIEDCQASVALTVKELELPAIHGVKRVNINPLTSVEHAAHNLATPLGSDAPAYVIYTSGSTGQPKGVVVPHRAIGRLVLNNRYAYFEASDRVAFTSNPAFDASTMEVWAPLLHGGCVLVISQGVLLEPNTLADLLRQEQVNILHLVAGLLSAYVEPLAPVFPRLRYLLTGGDVVDPRAVAKVLRQSPPQRLIHCYGPSESTTFATTHEVSEIPEGAKSIPIGRPIANTQIYILDRELQLVPAGAPGELYIGGKGVAHGYLGQPELTAERFFPDSLSKEVGARIYRTGDMARYLTDGRIEFLGRIDQQVKIRGFRIELGEIETQLSSHPAVRQCAVTAHQDETGEKRLGAYLVFEGEGEPSASELRGYLKERLPDYMLPSWFVWLDQMPLTPNGKVDRRALAALEVMRSEERAGYIAPRTPVEEILVGFLQEVLKLERVGIHDDFFEIGGHSLLATQVISRVRNTFDVGIKVRSVFEAPTVAKLAEALIAQEPKPGQTEKIALVLKKLNSMSDEDAGAELAARGWEAANERREGGN